MRERVRAELELTSDPTTASLFPHPFVARLAVTAGDALELAFEVVNTGDAPFEFEVALHTYFAVSDVGAVAVRGLGGCAYVDRVAGGARDRQDLGAPVRFDGEVDRVYECSGLVTLADPARGRAVRIEGTNAGSVVVWNPGAIKARTVADMSPEGFHDFVCVETGNVRDQRVTLPRGRPPRDPGPLRPFCATDHAGAGVRISQPSRVTSTVCSNWADSEPSAVTTVQPSSS